MTKTEQNKYLRTFTIFLLGGCFAPLLMYYTALSKNLDGIYNESIFITAAYFASMAALSLGVDLVLKWWRKHNDLRSKV